MNDQIFDSSQPQEMLIRFDMAWGIAILARAAAEVNAGFGLFAEVVQDGALFSDEALAQAIMLAADEMINGRFTLPPKPNDAALSHSLWQETAVHAQITAQANAHLLPQQTATIGPVLVEQHVATYQPRLNRLHIALSLGSLHAVQALNMALDAFLSESESPQRNRFAFIFEQHRARLQQASLPLQRIVIKQSPTQPEPFASRLLATLSRLTGFGLELASTDETIDHKTADFVQLSGTLCTLTQDLIRLTQTVATPLTSEDALDGVLAPLLQVLGNDHTVTLAGQAAQLGLLTRNALIADHLFQSTALLHAGVVYIKKEYLMKKLLIVAAAVLLLILAACGGGESGPATITIDYTGSDQFAFEPGTIEVASETQVTINFENIGVLEHNWMLISGNIDPTTVTEGEALSGATTGVISGGESASVTFTAPPVGSYQVVCTVPGHAAGGMVADFVVSDG